MKRVLSFLYMLPFSLMALAGDRVPEMHKEWSTSTGVIALIVGIILLVINGKQKDDDNDLLEVVGGILILGAIITLITNCSRHVVDGLMD